jgi:hypothetical protein
MPAVKGWIRVSLKDVFVSVLDPDPVGFLSFCRIGIGIQSLPVRIYFSQM